MNPTSSRIVAQLQELLGPAVLLPIPAGEKGPDMKGWCEATLADMTPEYLAALDFRKNIGVLLGKASNGLCSIDIDSDDGVEPFLKLNPKLAATLRTKGARGCNLWVRVHGDFPPLSKIKNRRGDAIGEWRADGGQTVIWGTHPSGCKYQRLVKATPAKLEFSDIVWPDDWVLPWLSPGSAALEAAHGAPYTVKNGRVSLNPVFFAAKFAAEHLTLWCPAENQFYQYDDARGLWCATSKDTLKMTLAVDLKRFADETGLKQLLNLRTNAMLGDLVELLKGHIENADAFDKPSPKIHLHNCVMDLSTNPPTRLPFAPEYYSRNQSPFDFVDGVDCPRFKSELLESALDADDIGLLQRWCGAVLLRHNATQKLLLLVGTAGGGKSSLVSTIERIIGTENCAELRTDLLFERFELARFIGKTLLTGKDVYGDFLQSRGAAALKKLVGHDLLSAELKRANGGVALRGDYNIVCTCNTRLQVRLDGDTEAWRRRLLVVEFSKPKPEKPIRDIADILLAEEGSGILYWMLQGAVRHLAELAATGEYFLTERQQLRIENLLNESDSIRHFLEEKVVPDDEGYVTSDELTRAYFDYCAEKVWHARSRREVENALPDFMLQVHRVNRRHDISRDGENRRGYSGVVLCQSEQPY